MAPSSHRIVSFGGTRPSLGDDVFVADTARVIGDVAIGGGSSVWFGAIIRGDVHHIRIGRNSNIQDMTMIHVTAKRHATIIGDDVTVGHRATLHGCTIESLALIGMGATVLDTAVVGAEAMIGAGAVVPPGTQIPPRTLWLGAPARYKRDLRADELAHLRVSASHYRELAQRDLAMGV